MRDGDHCVSISPMTVELEGRKWNARASFEVQNRMDEAVYDVWVKLNVEHPHICMDDFVVNTLDSTHESYREVLEKDSQRRERGKLLVIKKLNAHETWQFTVTKCTPYIESANRQPVLHAAVLSFDRKAPS